eukprot:CAMPEP_0174738186 /NCGR_PEP_ID=MMETSP1094-20130205/69549_1 /TAXON_ID=156173 /ORGANISM="Chrysochromulina brevifilum, Strain UTEX LB 985" /LENGTH=137 /DNA_ID=CAMNT_0015941547 /DNA_START=40 /DNA_END=453 /DNA_ORIENTATION=-
MTSSSSSFSTGAALTGNTQEAVNEAMSVLKLQEISTVKQLPTSSVGSTAVDFSEGSFKLRQGAFSPTFSSCNSSLAASCAPSPLGHSPHAKPPSTLPKPSLSSPLAKPLPSGSRSSVLKDERIASPWAVARKPARVS